MRVLLVEDDERFINGLLPLLSKAGGGRIQTSIANSRNAAVDALENEFFDTIILDLNLPTVEGAGDEAVEHGQFVFFKALQLAPGTPIFFLTGSSAEPFVRDLLRHARQEDVWGARKTIATVDLLPKTRLPEFVNDLAAMCAVVSGTNDIEISMGGKVVRLEPEERRVIRVFARRRNGASCSAAELSGGLSSSKVLRVKVFDRNGALQIDAAAKIGSLEKIEEEERKYDIDIPRLRPGTYAPRIETVGCGAKRTGGVFYGLLNGYEHSLFDRLRAGDVDPAIIRAIGSIFENWTRHVPTTSLTVGEIRRRLLADEPAQQLVKQYGLTWTQDLEAHQIQARVCSLHGDLHGGNILLDTNSTPMIIDYGELGSGVSAIDPVTLELSIFFHPDFASESLRWMTSDLASRWASGSHTEGTPVPQFLTACRSWAHALAAGDREVYSAAYSYLLRQLKYPETNKDLVLSLLAAFWTAFESTY